MAIKKYDLILSKIKVFIVVLLKPKRSSITKVLYIDIGVLIISCKTNNIPKKISPVVILDNSKLRAHKSIVLKKPK